VAGPGADKGDRWDPASSASGARPGGQGSPNANMVGAEVAVAAEATPPVPAGATWTRPSRSSTTTRTGSSCGLRPGPGQLVTLYNKAMGSQWNSVTTSTGRPTSTRAARRGTGQPAAGRGPGGGHAARLADGDLDGEGVHAARDRALQGQPLAVHARRAGAMMTAAKIVETVPWIDASTTPRPRRWTRRGTPRSSPSTSGPSSATRTR